MVEPKFECILVGKQYHKNKYGLKKLLKEHNMNFGGVREYPIWTGNSEYVRGDFKRVFNPETEEEETKEAKLSYYIKVDKEPTDFGKKFKLWCKKAAQSEPDSVIIEEPPKKRGEERPKSDRDELVEYAERTKPLLTFGSLSDIEFEELMWERGVKDKAIKTLGAKKGETWYREWRGV